MATRIYLSSFRRKVFLFKEGVQMNKYSLTKEEFVKLSESYNLIPVYKEIIADLETPVSAFQKIGDSKYKFLLESAERGEQFGRYSFLGCDPAAIISCQDKVFKIENGGQIKEYNCHDPLRELESFLDQYSFPKELELPPFCGGAVGYLGYEISSYYEEIPKTNFDELKVPDILFILTDTLLIFDHLKHKLIILANGHVQNNPELAYHDALKKIDNLEHKISSSIQETNPADDIFSSSETKGSMTKKEFLKAVEKAKKHIVGGDIFQVVLSQRYKAEVKADPFKIYRALRTINPSPYMFYLKLSSLILAGSSPEPLLKVENGQAMTRPIAGTRSRGRNFDEDANLAIELKTDHKERAEHLMLVDLGRNDLGRVCTAGTVKVNDFMDVENYSHVMHLVSTVKGELNKDYSPIDALISCFPAGTVSGAPKIRAMEIIDDLEKVKRGPYAGAAGYYSYSGDLDTCISIRTIIIKDGHAYIQAGAGIVYDSVPEKEYQEISNKARALFGAVSLAEEGKI